VVVKTSNPEMRQAFSGVMTSNGRLSRVGVVGTLASPVSSSAGRVGVVGPWRLRSRLVETLRVDDLKAPHCKSGSSGPRLHPTLLMEALTAPHCKSGSLEAR